MACVDFVDGGNFEETCSSRKALVAPGSGNTRYQFFHANISTSLGFRTISAHKVVDLLGTEPRVGGQGAIEGAPEDEM